jgi:predicted MPP superfamily phosphohydrolase
MELKLAGKKSDLTAPGLPRLFAYLPGNQILRPQLHEKQLMLSGLPVAWDGIRIAHLTDLHISGRIGKSYFAQVVDHVNDAQPDIIAITGDIIERERCIDWIPETLGRLTAPRGVYFVLGNHDQRVDRERLIAKLTGCGHIHMGGQTRMLEAESAESSRILLAGNELPWQGPAPTVPLAKREGACPGELRVLLAHTPDQFGWAHAHDFNLMLAGHNHGGQVCVPLLGAVLVPSRHGTRYAAGVFTRGKTVMHVGRGTSSLSPIRYNCPPEVAILVLRSAT